LGDECFWFDYSRSPPSSFSPSIAGFAAGLGVIGAVNAITPFNEDVDEDTFREFWPVALAYSTWALTSVVVVIGGVLGWIRWNERER
jgi:hypothetical protein